MKRWLRNVFATSVMGCALLGASSCADNENMLVIRGVMSPTPPDCVFQPRESSELLATGVVDKALTKRYRAMLLVANQLLGKGDKSRLRGESADVIINNAVVQLLVDGTRAVAPYSTPASGNVPVGAGEDNGYGAIPVDILLTDEAASAVRNYLIAEVKLQGKTTGGKDIESNVFRYELFVVDSNVRGAGLVTYNSDDLTGCEADSCSKTTSATYCSIGQDAPVSCCDCVSSYSFCR